MSRLPPQDDFGQLIDSILPDGRGLVCMISAYFDESYGEKPRIMCVAGLVYAGMKAIKFKKEWEPILRANNLDYFRMSECESGRKQFKGVPEPKRGRISTKLIGLTRELSIHGVAAAVSRDKYKSLAPPGWVRAYGTDYTACLMTVVNMVISWAKMNRPKDHIAFFFEKGPFEGEAREHLRKMSDDPVNKELFYHSISDSFVPKGEMSRPCEAADQFAWFVRKAMILPDRVGGGSYCETGRLPSFGEVRKDFKALVEGKRRQFILCNLNEEELQKLFQSQAPA